MNTFTIILAVAVAATAVLAKGGGKKNFEIIMNTCKTKVPGATADDIAEIKKHKTPSTRNGQCMLACIKKQLGMMDADNKTNVKVAKKIAESVKEKKPEVYAKMIKAIDECKAQETSETDECEAARKFSVCFRSKIQ